MTEPAAELPGVTSLAGKTALVTGAGHRDRHGDRRRARGSRCEHRGEP
jgi:hypothetical protein